MSLRIRSLADLPEAIRKGVASRLAAEPKTNTETPARRNLRLEELREERERYALILLQQLEAHGLACLFTREHRFYASRKWMLDLYASAYRVGVELHGGIWKTGRHLTPLGFISDREKMNAACEVGIRVLEYWPESIRDGTAVLQIKRVLESARGAPCPLKILA